ncbi:unnamed protein product, partial [Mycena citricolor]
STSAAPSSIPTIMSSTATSSTSSTLPTSPKNYEAALAALQSSFGIAGQSVPCVQPKLVKGSKKIKAGETVSPSTSMTRLELAHADLMA